MSALLSPSPSPTDSLFPETGMLAADTYLPPSTQCTAHLLAHDDVEDPFADPVPASSIQTRAKGKGRRVLHTMFGALRKRSTAPQRPEVADPFADENAMDCEGVGDLETDANSLQEGNLARALGLSPEVPQTPKTGRTAHTPKTSPGSPTSKRKHGTPHSAKSWLLDVSNESPRHKRRGRILESHRKSIRILGDEATGAVAHAAGMEEDELRQALFP